MMLLQPVRQEGAFIVLTLWVVPILFGGISIFFAARAFKHQKWSVVPRVVGVILGSLPAALAFGAMMTSTGYTFPESYLFQGFLLSFGVLCIAIGDAISESMQRTEKKKAYQFKGTHWILMNAVPAAGVGYLLSEKKFFLAFVPVMLLTAAACQWLLLKRVYPVSPWWLLSAVFWSAGYFTDLAENLMIGFYIGGVLMAAFQYYLLRPHDSNGAVLFALAVLFSWWVFGSLLKYVAGSYSTPANVNSAYYVPRELRVLSFYGLVTIWSSVIVGPVAAWALKPRDEKDSLSNNPMGEDEA